MSNRSYGRVGGLTAYDKLFARAKLILIVVGRNSDIGERSKSGFRIFETPLSLVAGNQSLVAVGNSNFTVAFVGFDLPLSGRNNGFLRHQTRCSKNYRRDNQEKFSHNLSVENIQVSIEKRKRAVRSHRP